MLKHQAAVSLLDQVIANEHLRTSLRVPYLSLSSQTSLAIFAHLILPKTWIDIQAAQPSHLPSVYTSGTSISFKLFVHQSFCQTWCNWSSYCKSLELPWKLWNLNSKVCPIPLPTKTSQYAYGSPHPSTNYSLEYWWCRGRDASGVYSISCPVRTTARLLLVIQFKLLNFYGYGLHLLACQ